MSWVVKTKHNVHHITGLSIILTVYGFASGASAPVSTLIDETMPVSIPDSIVADWKLQDGIGSDYSAAIEI